MAEYIDRIAFREKIDYHYPFDEIAQKDPKYDYAKSVFLRQLATFPAADVVERKTGKWIGYPECLKYANAYSDDHIVCSACEECFSILDNDCERFNFCPHCGAQMIGGNEDV